MSLKKAKSDIDSLSYVDRNAMRTFKEIGIEKIVLVELFDEKSWKCPSEGCELLSKTILELKRHYFNVHNPRPYLCTVDNCEWTFPTKCKLERHQQAHADEKVFKCDFEGCKKSFKTKFNVRYHIKTAHVAVPKFKCDMPECNAVFHCRRYLDRHVTEHKHAKPTYKCYEPTCGKEFFSNFAISTHMRVHNSYSQEDLTCPECNKSFTIPCRLRSHMLSHSSSKPFPCKEVGCEWSFANPSKLARHMERHLRIRNYSCSFSGCSKKFIRREHLEEHEKIHARKKRYRCPVQMCGAVFDFRYQVPVHAYECHSTEFPRKGKKALPQAPSENTQEEEALVEVQTMSMQALGSARTSLTYCDVLEEKQNKGVETGEPQMQDQSIQFSEPSKSHELTNNMFTEPNGCSTPRKIAGHQNQSGELPVSDSSIIQEDLQDYLLLMDSTRLDRLSDFEQSTINLRDLE